MFNNFFSFQATEMVFTSKWGRIQPEIQICLHEDSSCLRTACAPCATLNHSVSVIVQPVVEPMERYTALLQAAGAGAAEAQGGGRQRHAQAGGRQHQRAHHHDGGEGSRHDHPGLRY